MTVSVISIAMFVMSIINITIIIVIVVITNQLMVRKKQEQEI